MCIKFVLASERPRASLAYLKGGAAAEVYLGSPSSWSEGDDDAPAMYFPGSRLRERSRAMSE